jgi:hypothetical protein
MLEKLKYYYHNHIIIDELPSNYNEYMWYTDSLNQTIGIKKKQLTKKDEELLSVFLNPIAPEDFHQSHKQRIWKDFLFCNRNLSIPPEISDSTKLVRFLHFSLKEAFFEKKAWEEALSGLLSSSFITAWKDNMNGVIIETYTSSNPDFTVDTNMFQTLTTDFFITLSVLIGKPRRVDCSLLSWFQWEQTCFRTAKHYVKTQHMFELEDVLPYLLIEKSESISPILDQVREDKELLGTVKAYLECNMNVSLAAKKQYMHRNSVQYRVDKFIEKTGIDIKTFKGAVAIYCALLINEAVNS